MLSVGQKILGNYAVEKVIGAGGAGEVFLVRRENDGKQYAVKTIHSRKTEATQLRQDLLREIKISQNLGTHPNIVPVRFFRLIDGHLAVFSDFISGGSLARWMQTGRLKHRESVIDIAIRTAWGLSATHQAGILHKDMKPSNILMEKSGRPRLADFGLIRGMTPGYCSPEQMSGENLTSATDIWSWALVVMAMWMGKRSWQFGGQAGEHLSRLRLDSNAFGAAPASLIKLLGQCLEFKADRRPLSMSTVASDLKTIYHEITGQSYSITEPPEIESDPKNIQSDRKSVIDGLTVEDPMEYLKTIADALEASDINVDQLVPEVQNQPATFIDDLHAYMFIEDLLRRAGAQGNPWILKELSYTLKRKAWLLFDSGDKEGAVSIHLEANEILKELILWHNQPELWSQVAGNYSDITFCLSHASEHDRVARYNDLARDALDRLPKRFRTSTYHQDYHQVLTMSGILATDDDSPEVALTFFIQARDRLRMIPRDATTNKILSSQAKSEFNIGTFLEKTAEHRAAIDHYRESRRIQLQLSTINDLTEQTFLATIHQNIGICFGHLNDRAAAQREFEKAEAIYANAISRSMHPHIQFRYAFFLKNYGHFWMLTGDYPEAIRCLTKAVDILKQLIETKGAMEHRLLLVKTLEDLSNNYSLAGDMEAAEKALEQAEGYR